MDEEKLDFSVEDEYENFSSYEYQLDNMKVLNIGSVESDSEVFGYMSIYKSQPSYAFLTSKIEEPNYIERYDVFEIKLNPNCDMIEGFQILGCPVQDIEYAELFLKMQEKKPRSLIRFQNNDLEQNKPTTFLNKGWTHLPCSFLKNKPEYFLEIQLKDNCTILQNDLVRIQVDYIFLSNEMRKLIDHSNEVQVGSRKLLIQDKILKLQ